MKALLPKYVFGCILALCFISRPCVASLKKLAADPSMISLIYYEPAENFSSSFGHVDLRISYGKVPSVKDDIAIGFGPEVKAGFNPGPLEYFGIGNKLNLISWTENFETAYLNASRERMVGIISMELNLTPFERNQIIRALNDNLGSSNPPSYHAIFKNCASEIADVLENFSHIKKGWFSFHPGFLEKKLAKHTRNRLYYPSGRELKTQALVNFGAELGQLAKVGLNHQTFKAQFLSAKTEFRILAFRKLIKFGASARLLASLLGTESPRRAKLLQTKVSDQNYPTYEFAVAQKNSATLSGVKIKNEQLVLSYPTLPRGPASHANEREVRTTSWRLAELGIKQKGPWRADGHSVGAKGAKQSIFWLAKDLNVDPR